MSKRDLTPWYDFRAAMVDALEADLVGSAADELLSERPMDRFIVGILHPQDGATLEQELEEAESGDAGGSSAESVYDPAVAMAHARKPSSMGLTFAIDPSQTPTIEIDIDAARYVEEPGEEDSPVNNWRRVAAQVDPIGISTTQPNPEPIELEPGLNLHVVVRQPRDGQVSITAVVINDQRVEKGLRDGLCWFQPAITVRTPQGHFTRRPDTGSTSLDDNDVKSYALLFRDVQDLAVGHGCATDWDEGEHVTELRTTFIPRHDVPLAEPAGKADIDLTMSSLGDGKLAGLDDLADDYAAWIARLSERANDSGEFAGDLQQTAIKHAQEAAEAHQRMKTGIELLQSSSEALEAFQLMNQAMQQQRDWQDEQRGQKPREQSWRPFQIAFVLINLEGLTNADSAERDHADLLWFPTGGGKTEAYLGLIAYAILLRRLRNPQHGGVSVLMRYTLRLLTIQQFERAAGLICALEVIRRNSIELQSSPEISLGLWVGMGATPNNVTDARRGINNLTAGSSPKNGNPVQILHCPACGTKLGLQDYKVQGKDEKLEVHCPNHACAFTRLPVHLVDEDVYRERPSLVIGTVDKFAMMAWREQVRNLFSRDGKHPPPDLIVQDELHLISGPLGTMVGLYETAVDAACSGPDGHRPKVVASTATIRRASAQVRAVFDREAKQFPPSGIDSSDSYFSTQASAEDKGTRQYVGVMAPSTSQATLLVRTYAALLQAARDIDIASASDEVRDAYWTLLGYFNSLRVLGGAYMQVLDDVPARIKVVAGRGGSAARELREPGELTSRVESSQIPESLQALSTPYPDDEAEDVVLATNMISVGVDIDRLALMAVMGQPQTTAEYIQSTSRVGRQHPGLVVVMYNGSRSRDLSHYENFSSYHRALYRQVEATGATPFAQRARDRGLHGVLVSLIRLMVDDLAADDAAHDLKSHRAKAEQVAHRVVQRAESLGAGNVDEVKAEVTKLLNEWETGASESPSLKYPGWRRSEGALLVDPSSQIANDEAPVFPVDEAPWPTMTSLRDVDATSALYLVKGRKEEGDRHGQEGS